MLEIWKDRNWLDEASYLPLWNMKETDPSLPATIFTPTQEIMTQASDSVRFRQSDTLAQDFEFWITQRKLDSPNLFTVTVVVTVFVAKPQLPNLMCLVCCFPLTLQNGPASGSVAQLFLQFLRDCWSTQHPSNKIYFCSGLLQKEFGNKRQSNW